MRTILYAVFTLSGAAGLIYELIWARYLALFMGHRAYAQVLVLAIFLGGMALGALLVGSRSERWGDPLKGYAAVELAVGVIGIFFHDVYMGATGFAYDSVFPALAGTGFLTLFKWALAAALILPQSILLGATFPLMAAGFLRRVGERPGRTLSLLYSTNSLGAAVGVLIAGFYLVALAGLPGALLVAAMINLLAALIAAVVSHRYPAGEKLRVVETVEDAPSAVAAGTGPLPVPQLLRLLLAVSFGTAVASFAYEIGWLRMLALVLGSATHSFELMLSAFILGLAAGSFWVRRRADRWRMPLRTLAIVQLGMGLAALATLALYDASFLWMAWLLRAFARTHAGYAGWAVARYGICLAIMFPASFCAGMTLPLITRTLLVAGAGERSIGAVYGVNTLGAILGVTMAGLLLMPLIGLKGLIVGGAALDMALGALILVIVAGASLSARRLAYGAVALTLVAAMVGVLSRGFDQRLLVSGVYRHGQIAEPGQLEMLYYRDGRTATVAVDRGMPGGRVTIRANGKPDASLDSHWFEACTDSTARRALTGDASTQTLAPLITLAHAPDARIAAVIGQGSGMSSHFLLGSPRIEELVTVEIEPEMVRGSRAFYPANRRVFDDPRSTIVIDDAKTYFAAAPARFDLIFSEPSNPWVSGVSSLFASEFYAHIKRYLTEDGVLGQWLHLYEINDGLVLTVLAAVHQNFASYEIFLTHARDMLVVASPAPALRAPDWSVFGLPAIAEDLCRIFPITPGDLEATRLTHRRALAPLLDGWARPNSDFYPVLDLLAERARFLGSSAAGFLALPTDPFDVTAPFFGRRSLPGAHYPAPVPSILRMRALALGGALRGTAGPAEGDSAEITATLRWARYRKAQWDAQLASRRRPPDWGAWLANFGAIERDLDTGTAGYADEDFYRPVFEFVDRLNAPDVVRNVVAFRHGLAAWDFKEASRAALALLEEDAAMNGYIRSDELLDGGVIALLRTGDVAGAERLYDALVTRRRRSDGDLRSRLVEAYLNVYRKNRAGSAGSAAFGG